MAPFLAALAKAGLSLIGNAVLAKGKEVVEEKLGVKIPENPAEYTPEKVAELAKAQMAHQEFLVKAALEEAKLEVEDRKDARLMQARAIESQDPVVRRFIYFFSWFWSIFSGIYISCVTFLPVPQDNQYYVATILGFVLGTIVGGIITFFYGGVHRSSNQRASDAPAR